MKNNGINIGFMSCSTFPFPPPFSAISSETSCVTYLLLFFHVSHYPLGSEKADSKIFFK